MRIKTCIRHTYASNELLGGLLLLLIAILSFSAIYVFVFPLPAPDVETHVRLSAYVASDGSIVIEHDGGEVLTAYRVDVRDRNGTLLGSTTYSNQSEWMEIGDSLIPISEKLENEDDSLQVTVVSIEDSQEVIFDGILFGHPDVVSVQNDTTLPYLISSLLTDSTNEDLICFNKTSSGVSMNASFSATNNMFNWKVDSTSIYNLLYGFDIDNNVSILDFSNNNFDGSVSGATWTSSGKTGGGISFDGDDFITVPYCFPASTVGDFSVEVWIKTNQSDGTILSFNRSDYFSLALVNGKVKWSVSANGNTADLVGLVSVSDNIWHHIATTYDQSAGTSSIYVDGIIDVSNSGLSAGDFIGSGSQIEGYIGKERGTISSSSYQSFFTDNFETDKGWTVEDSVYLSDGGWEIGDPKGLGERGDPPDDADGSGNCSLTDNERGNSDVDGGYTRLISPVIDFSSYENVSIEFSVWYTNDYGSNKDNDYFYVSISNDNGSTWTTALTIGPDTPSPYGWYDYSIQAEDFITFTSQVKLRFEVSDYYGGSVVEAGVDAINISGIITGGIGNYSGSIDDLRIVKRMLSEEQIYQDYLIGNAGQGDISVIVSEETITGQDWLCEITPINQLSYAAMETTNVISIVSYGGG